jgi:diguanylate cyclase (GGDEF)-like protein
MRADLNPRRYPPLLRAALLCLAGALLLAAMPAGLVLGLGYLPLHTGLETAAVAVAFTIFAVAWFGAAAEQSRNTVLLSLAFLVVALCDLGHLLSFPGMPPMVTPSSTSKAIAFWLGARSVAALALLAVALAPDRHGNVAAVRRMGLVLALAGAAALWMVVLYLPGALPATYLPASGLTPFKRAAEYFLTAVLALAALAYLSGTPVARSEARVCLGMAAALMALSGLYFAWYRSADDLVNALGHVVKVLAYLLLFRGVIIEAVREPYRRLHESEGRLARSEMQRLSAERALHDHHQHDPLTGLPNRSGALAALAQMLEEAQRSWCRPAVIMLGVEQFHRVNDSFGHAEGERVLRQVAARLLAAAPGCQVARQAGDIFIVLQGWARRQRDAIALAQQLLAALEPRFDIGGHELYLDADIGIAMADGCGAEVLLQRAQLALHHAKPARGRRYRFHQDFMDHSVRERLDIENALRHAVGRDQLYLLYQPRVSLASGAIVGVEALLRWRHPQLGEISPARFIPVAEGSGQIAEIGLWVLRQACQQARAWQCMPGMPELRVSVNLSASQFRHLGLANQVDAVLRASGLAPHLLELELTESTVMHDAESAIVTLRALKRLGLSLSVDDFGTGYSSLACLKRFPIDTLKIDKSFVDDAVTGPSDGAITCAIIALGHVLQLEVVAEGVETAEQVDFLRANGCDQIQGFHFSRPVPADDIARMAQAGRCLALAPLAHPCGACAFNPGPFPIRSSFISSE